uniref:Retrotransposon protein, putative, Ty3-gypsy subclass n=1 Tax=Oryza sativa subsp. japonica TaxID=39947 RepID=Q10I43_ORYSJ|nr:retrotransposon protein, putative, Ty3-gypsy subclass [Oryza sativa Japonica Group]
MGQIIRLLHAGQSGNAQYWGFCPQRLVLVGGGYWGILPPTVFEDPNLERKACIINGSKLDDLVEDKLLPAQEIIGWRLAITELFPTPNTSEIIGLEPFFHHGFALATSDFYGIELIHVNLTLFSRLLSSSTFVKLSWDPPHFALFRHLFNLKPQPS